MQIETELTQIRPLKPAFHDIQGSLLFGNEKYPSGGSLL